MKYTAQVNLRLSIAASSLLLAAAITFASAAERPQTWNQFTMNAYRSARRIGLSVSLSPEILQFDTARIACLSPFGCKDTVILERNAWKIPFSSSGDISLDSIAIKSGAAVNAPPMSQEARLVLSLAFSNPCGYRMTIPVLFSQTESHEEADPARLQPAEYDPEQWARQIHDQENAPFEQSAPAENSATPQVESIP